MVRTSSFYISRDVMYHDAFFHNILASRVIVSYNQDPQSVSIIVFVCQEAQLFSSASSHVPVERGLFASALH
jgi:hypothetical protein